MERIVGVIHLIDAEDSFQATLVERLVMGYERETGYLGFYLLPNFREDRSILCIGGAQAMHLTAPVVVIFRFWFDERVELIHYLAAANYDNANRAYRTALVVGCFKIYCCKVLHISWVY